MKFLPTFIVVVGGFRKESSSLSSSSSSPSLKGTRSFLAGFLIVKSSSSSVLSVSSLDESPFNGTRAAVSLVGGLGRVSFFTSSVSDSSSSFTNSVFFVSSITSSSSDSDLDDFASDSSAVFSVVFSISSSASPSLILSLSRCSRATLRSFEAASNPSC